MADGQWIGMDSVWYMSALIPHGAGFKLVAQGDDKACESKTKEPVGRATIAVQASPTIAPGQAWEGRVTSSGRRSTTAEGRGLEEAINFGGFPVPGVRRPADGVAGRTDPRADELGLSPRRQLRRRDHPADRRSRRCCSSRSRSRA